MSSVPGTEQAIDTGQPGSMPSETVEHLSEISRNSRTTFFALILSCVYSYLAIATTTDAALLSNSSASPLPIIQVNVPIVWFYYFAPIILAVLFVYFHLYLERFWRCVVRLPLHHPDGRGLDDYVYPWLISSALIRGEIPELSNHRKSARLEAWLSLLLAWWLVPIVLLFYWGRYLTAHDWVGTSLHIVLILITTSFSLRYIHTARRSLREVAERSACQNNSNDDGINKDADRDQLETTYSALGVFALGVALVYLSASAIYGLSDKDCASLGPADRCNLLNPGENFWTAIGYVPNAVVKEEKFVQKPKDWQKLLDDPVALRSYLDSQRALVLIGRDMRSMSGQNAFLPGSRIHASILDFANLQHAVLTASRVEDAVLSGTDLTDADLQHTTIVNSDFADVFAMAARFNHARFEDATSEKQTTLSGDFSGAYFDDADGSRLIFLSDVGGHGETSLRESSLRGTSFTWSLFDGVDMGRANIDDATLTHNRFLSVDFSRAQITNAVLNSSTFKGCRFESAVIRSSWFEEAKFIDTQFGRAPTQGINSETASREPFRDTYTDFNAFRAEFIEATKIRNIEFADSDFRFASFEDVEFSNVVFSNTDLSGATFVNVDLSGVEFRTVYLSGANLRSARNIQPRLLEGACGNAETMLPDGMTVRACRESSQP